MLRFFFIILVGAVYCSGVSVCNADNLVVNNQSPSQIHLQAVKESLDSIESSGKLGDLGVRPGTANPSPFSPAIIPKRNEFAVSSETYVTKYDEVKDLFLNGVMTGYNVQYFYRTNPSNAATVPIVGLEGQWAQGKLKTQPADQGPSGIKAFTYDLRALLGEDLYPTNHLRVTSYLGFGFRYLRSDSEGLNTVTNDYVLLGYNKFSHYCYLPLGLGFVYQNSPKHSIETNFEWDPILKAWQEDKLGVVSGYNTIVFDQKNGDGYRFSLKLNFYFKYCTAFVEGFYRFWDIAGSKAVPNPTNSLLGLTEPKNNTEEFGLRLGLQI